MLVMQDYSSADDFLTSKIQHYYFIVTYFSILRVLVYSLQCISSTTATYWSFKMISCRWSASSTQLLEHVFIYVPCP